MKTEASCGKRAGEELGFGLGWDQYASDNLVELREVGQNLGS